MKMEKDKIKIKADRILKKLQTTKIRRKLPSWAIGAIIGAGLSLGACEPPVIENDSGVDAGDITNNSNVDYGAPLYAVIDGSIDASDIDDGNVMEYGVFLYGMMDSGDDSDDVDSGNVPEYGAS
jgi:hypothetical protein